MSDDTDCTMNNCKYFSSSTNSYSDDSYSEAKESTGRVEWNG